LHTLGTNASFEMQIVLSLIVIIQHNFRQDCLILKRNQPVCQAFCGLLKHVQVKYLHNFIKLPKQQLPKNVASSLLNKK